MVSLSKSIANPKIRGIVRSLLNSIVWIILAVLLVVFSITIKGFFTVENFQNIIYHSVFIGMLAIAETLVLISGNMDLSVESTAAGTAIVGVWLAGASATASGLMLNTWATLGIILFLGAAMGAINAFFIVKLKINAFLVTLATYIIIRGVAVFITKGYGMNDLAPDFRFIDTTKIFGLPLMVYLLIIFYVVFQFILRNTRFGRHVYVIGGNKNAAYNFGIHVDKVLFQVFILSGLISAVTGWLMAARVNGANAGIGGGFLFEVLAAVVIGGVGLTGGVGSLTGVLAGTLILGMIHNAINITAISPLLTDIVRGSLILIAITLDSLKRKFR
jgi:ribose transport system permease protein